MKKWINSSIYQIRLNVTCFLNLTNSICTIGNIYIFFIATLCFKTKTCFHGTLFVWKRVSGKWLYHSNFGGPINSNGTQQYSAGWTNAIVKWKNYVTQPVELARLPTNEWTFSDCVQLSFEWAGTVARLIGSWTLSIGLKRYWNAKSEIVLFRAKDHMLWTSYQVNFFVSIFYRLLWREFFFSQENICQKHFRIFRFIAKVM